MLAATDAGHQRTEFALGGLPAAYHDLMPGADLGLGPVLGAAGTIGRVAFLGDNALEQHLLRRLQHGLAVLVEMLDITDQLCLAFRLQQ